MPNHVTTRCIITGPEADVSRLVAQVITVTPSPDTGPARRGFDFNAIVKMPEILQDSQESSTAEDGAILLLIANDEDSCFFFPDFSRTLEPSRAAAGTAHLKAVIAGNGVVANPDRFTARDRQDAYAFLARAEGLGGSQHVTLTMNGLMKVIADQHGSAPKSPFELDADHIRAAARARLDQKDRAAQGLKRLTALAETGHVSWYPWSIENWGTKWNSYSFSEESLTPGRFEFTFDTAWSFPTPVFERLAAMFPELEFECACYDEGHGFIGAGAFNGRGDKPAFTIVDDPSDAVFNQVYTFVTGEEAPKYDDDFNGPM